MLAKIEVELSLYPEEAKIADAIVKRFAESKHSRSLVSMSTKSDLVESQYHGPLGVAPPTKYEFVFRASSKDSIGTVLDLLSHFRSVPLLDGPSLTAALCKRFTGSDEWSKTDMAYAIEAEKFIVERVEKLADYWKKGSEYIPGEGYRQALRDCAKELREAFSIV